MHALQSSTIVACRTGQGFAVKRKSTEFLRRLACHFFIDSAIFFRCSFENVLLFGADKSDAALPRRFVSASGWLSFPNFK
jgi:hypothetical protein